jgi:hypothetical protein
MINKNFLKFTTLRGQSWKVKNHLFLLTCMHIQRKKAFLCMVAKKNKIHSFVGNFPFYFGKTFRNLYIINATSQLINREEELRDYLSISSSQLTIVILYSVHFCQL